VSKQLPENPEIETLTRIQILTAMGLTAVVWLVITKLTLQFSHVSLLRLYWSPVDLLLGIALAVVITISSSIIYRIWPAYKQSADFYLNLILKPLVLPDLIWLGLLPGLSEELLFRGIGLPLFGLNATGIIASSISFGILHFNSLQQWPYVVWATTVGLFLGFSAVETGNLLVPIIAHILTNVISGYMWKMGNKE
jgi:membrane protease YdiL (CAAX protease family)